ncbi:MAG: hypothetical protein EHM72_19645, partial [Calditrichaeota bacterium]
MKHLTVNRFITSIIFLCLTAAHSESLTLEQTLTPSNSLQSADKIEIYVRWTDKEIKIDGRLDEEAWNEALPYEAFFYQLQPEDRAPSSEKTRVMVLQDDRTIYFGIHCYDSDPDTIFATSMR